jgi:hypothetical protein
MAWGSKELSMRRCLHGVFALAKGAALALSLSCAAYGCSNSNGNINAAHDAEAVCPNTVTAAAGAKCAYTGLVCSIGYLCGSFAQQATCTCNNGRTFDCTDSTGQSVDPSGTPACTSNGGGHDNECPASEALAINASCKTAGLLCAYANNCPPINNVGGLDQCQCTGGRADGGFVFVCEPQCSTSDAGSGADAPIDSPQDAPNDGPTAG